MRRAVATRASGLPGSHLAEAVGSQAEVLGLDIRPPRAGHQHAEVSILDFAALAAGFAGADCVLHFAAAPNIGSASAPRIVALNALGTWNVLEAALEADVRRVVLCSTDSVMGNTVWPEFFWCPERLPVPEDHPLEPADPYGVLKLMAETAGRSYARRDLQVLALRSVFILFASMMGEARAHNADPDGYRGPVRGRPCGGRRRPALARRRSTRRGGGLPTRHRQPVAGLRELLARRPLDPASGADARVIRQTFGRLPGTADRALYEGHPHAPMFDTRQAAEHLGWQARHDHRAAVLGADRRDA